MQTGEVRKPNTSLLESFPKDQFVPIIASSIAGSGIKHFLSCFPREHAFDELSQKAAMTKPYGITIQSRACPLNGTIICTHDNYSRYHFASLPNLDDSRLQHFI